VLGKILCEQAAVAAIEEHRASAGSHDEIEAFRVHDHSHNCL
jgi:hypothetical protein